MFLPGKIMHIISIETFKIKSGNCVKLRNKTTEPTRCGFLYGKSKYIVFIVGVQFPFPGYWHNEFTEI